ncbi:MAG TPA: alpha-glucan family phosphorylase [Anaerolineae bacterium]|nr:alpha-glucan family phosphorylase [Anaerolineae bacterium]
MTPIHMSLRSFSLPKPIARLGELAYNLWWSWHPLAPDLFGWMDEVLWQQVTHNPVKFLQQIHRSKINGALQSTEYMALYQRVFAEFDTYMEADDTWMSRTYPNLLSQPIAYFSTEFGLHESLPMYAGGLGVLSGDHLKEASDLGLPLIGVGFLYREGYFRQRITEDGWQEAINEPLNLSELALLPEVDEAGRQVTVHVELPGRGVTARVWRVQVGRVPLFLIDTHVDTNDPTDQQLAARLYYSDLERRLQQEIILGIGGVRALRALGYNPVVWHMNEGHSVFLSLERAVEIVRSGRTLEEAREKISRSTIFTTHTPVPAGHDKFPIWLIEKYFAGYWSELGLDRDDFLNLALEHEPWGDMFSMTLLALRFSAQVNGVSELHGQVTRRMFAHLWPTLTEDEIPIRSITNGIHTFTWLARRMAELYDRYLGADWRERLDDQPFWDRIWDIPDDELWAARRHLKRQLGGFVRERARDLWMRGGTHPVQVVAGGVLLDPYALTIGFARRFATYKRATLLLHDVDRLRRIIHDPARPVQFIFAGKAHPADDPGKHLIQDLYRFVKEAGLGGRMVFLEDYDLNVARHLVQGVDVWMNTPRRPLEASGTSGEKAVVNGVLNFSVLDGWWREGYNGRNGWAIGEEQAYADTAQQDAADAKSLFDTLENDIVPLYYERPYDNRAPSGWVRTVKESIRTMLPMFCTSRMLKEYMNEMYVPAAQGSVSELLP